MEPSRSELRAQNGPPRKGSPGVGHSGGTGGRPGLAVLQEKARKAAGQGGRAGLRRPEDGRLGSIVRCRRDRRCQGALPRAEGVADAGRLFARGSSS